MTTSFVYARGIDFGNKTSINLFAKLLHNAFPTLLILTSYPYTKNDKGARDLYSRTDNLAAAYYEFNIVGYAPIGPS